MLSLLQKLAQPVLRQKRAEHQLRLLDAAELSLEVKNQLIRLGLSPRQAEVALWMLKGKSNTNIGAILDIGAQTVRQYSIAVFRRFGVGGRLALQRCVLRCAAGID